MAETIEQITTETTIVLCSFCAIASDWWDSYQEWNYLKALPPWKRLVIRASANMNNFCKTKQEGQYQTRLLAGFLVQCRAFNAVPMKTIILQGSRPPVSLGTNCSAWVGNLGKRTTLNQHGIGNGREGAWLFKSTMHSDKKKPRKIIPRQVHASKWEWMPQLRPGRGSSPWASMFFRKPRVLRLLWETENYGISWIWHLKWQKLFPKQTDFDCHPLGLLAV